MVIQRIGVASAAKIVGLLEVAIGLFAGLLFAVISTFAGFASARNGDMPAWLAPFFGIGALIAFPIIYGVIGVIAGAVGALLYNALAAVVGGLEIDVS
jgi:hypothetical protein